MALELVDHLDGDTLAAARALLARVIAADSHRGVGAEALQLLARPGRAAAVVAPGRDGGLDGLAFARVQDGTSWTVELTVDPDRRGRGLGGALLGAALEAAPDGTVARVWAYRPGPAQRRLAGRFGLAPILRLEQLRGPTGGADAAVRPPPGVRLRGWRPGDLDALVEVHNAAFASERVTAELVADRLARPFMGPDHLVMAELDGEAVGHAWMASPRPDGEGDGHGELVYLAVHPAAAGLGVGSALLAAGLGLLAGRGVERCMLYMDAANAPARRLYERVGFRFHHADLLLGPGRAEVAW